ncbi:5-carboxymethyl-2-hydroxymuconate Delta-isomerase [Pseudomonas sp. P7]|jgi:5-carboxymethyl-2-hydroxymuconate isomerase|uniref:5-carboxymethyl-2-hydroxymuconate Delta-isomerase n=1 Tax=Pseudomonas sivasensis TaxID=1880678 RepID=A0ABW8E229_9PSED|nr:MULTISPECIES: 5-carboxymethyl-2-hydroxymuconate Delta-isomerase [Pseudomonas]EZP64843.1 5-carboxymethyl-2-hydroxymuconate isomerase [Pseudomonas sp. RIT357]MBA2925255.1 5-carboxymethyl-2-hydroxymuconate Delta-isomerase [Pseudomonas sivasensis]MBA2929039.1 5-carboxymethyl-2-hydroxymuconate Delta-isomerase [Pseudomonas sivasensis]MCT4497351.1 5-carboxymethyl-2-hydroxymuconate Delta-isomerase [Pseudomonas sivasensis]OYT77149.1 MAG: 5-carboxymethyl-2-hydroxymuconate isomerase [Pseudomonas sp. P
MPHLHLEYTANLTDLTVDKTLLRLNNVLMASGQFGSEFDIKSRAVKLEHFQVGTSLNPRGFIAVKLSLLSGRSPQVKQQLSESLLAVLQDLSPWPEGVQVQLSVELRDMDRDAYSKVAIG